MNSGLDSFGKAIDNADLQASLAVFHSALPLAHCKLSVSCSHECKQNPMVTITLAPAPFRTVSPSSRPQSTVAPPRT